MQDTTRPILPILGAGPAGLAAAYALTHGHGKYDAVIKLIDAAPQAGGNSTSFQIDGLWCDYGSHRFHPVAEPEVLNMVKELLGDDLLLRPRHGRIRLGGRWIHFPLKLGDALLHLPASFAASLIADMLLKPFRPKSQGAATFSSVLNEGLGPTISRNFYFPYVRKLWGLDPDKLAVTLAERRVSGSSIGKILAKMLRMLPGLKGETTGKFYYPAQGFGQISTAMAEAAQSKGAELKLGHMVRRILRQDDRVTGVELTGPDGDVTLSAPMTLSTIPVTTLVQLMDPPAPDKVLDAAHAIRFRGMVLIYLVLETDQFTEFDAHYFPEAAIPMSRMSEPRNYNQATDPKGITVLCAELPCDPSDPWWDMSDADLGQAMCGWLNDMGLSVTVPVRSTLTRRLRHAYPVYDIDYQRHFEVLDNWISGLEGILNFGRQGLFAHDNTHHAYAMAYGAVESLGPDGVLDKAAWTAKREIFAHHVVED
ncbi:MAG: protoporphyrinogen/coproporphyrinogen oxidase [Mangrovicoccus sp.]